MLIAVPPSLVITAANLLDPIAWITPLMHASKGSRVYPFFGEVAPINDIRSNNEADKLITLGDGTQVFLRYGVYNKVYETIAGGLCYAAALQSLNKSGYNIIQIDQTGQMLLHANGDDTWKGLITSFMYSPSPLEADFDNPYKNRFQLSHTPVELVQNGEVFTGAGALLGLMGLLDAKITKASAATTTKLKIAVSTDCAGADLVARLGANLGTHANNFDVQDVATLGTPVALSAAAIVTGWIELTGTFTTGNTYRVRGALPSAWLANGISGYDAEDSYIDILIP
jgi:hypothetical protein